MVNVQLASCTHRGCVRPNNQDMALVRVLPSAALFGVCDGMGGELGGEIAAALCAETMEQAALELPLDTAEHASQLLVQGLRMASRRVHHEAQVRRLYKMGTTASIATIVGERMIYGQVGDSRIYVLRSGALYQVTRDQSLAQMMIERGQLRPEEMEKFSMKNVILQAVGPQPSVDVDVKSVLLGRGDVVLACSDGLFGAIEAREILDTLLANPDPETACSALVDAAIAAEASDNVTCVVALVTSGVDRSHEPITIEVLY
jgi:protein phosphatase